MTRESYQASVTQEARWEGCRSLSWPHYSSPCGTKRSPVSFSPLSLPLCSAELLTNHRGHSVCGRAHLSCIQYICSTILTAQTDNKSSMGPVLHKDVLGHVPLTLTFDLSPSKRNAQDSLRHAPSPPAASSSTGSAIDCLWHRFLPQVGNWGSCS